MQVIYRVAQKVSHSQLIYKLYQIVLKPVNEIKLIRQIKLWINHYIIIRWY